MHQFQKQIYNKYKYNKSKKNNNNNNNIVQPLTAIKLFKNLTN